MNPSSGGPEPAIGAPFSADGRDASGSAPASTPASGRRPALVAIDVDGTLLRSDHTLAPRTVRAVRAATDAGILVALASARPPRALAVFLDELGLLAPACFVACQGALVGSYDDAGRLEVIARTPLDAHDTAETVAAARELGLTVNWYAGERWLVDRITPGVEHESRVVGFGPEVVDRLDDLPAPEKLLLVSETNEAVRAAERLASRLGDRVSVVASNEHNVEVTASGVGKAQGVRAVAERLGIASRDALAIGDGLNDLGLFDWAGASIAPANAHPLVRERADRVVPANDDDGVAIALEELVASGLGRAD